MSDKEQELPKLPEASARGYPAVSPAEDGLRHFY